MSPNTDLSPMPGKKRKKPLTAWGLNDVELATFNALAKKNGGSESALLVRLIRSYLSGAGEGVLLPIDGGRGVQVDTAKTATIPHRVTPQIKTAFCDLAQQANQKPGTYLANLIHAHVTRAPRFNDDELQAFTDAIRHVSAIGNNLNQIARQLHAGAGLGEGLPVALDSLRGDLSALRSEMKSLVQANVRTWGIDG